MTDEEPKPEKPAEPEKPKPPSNIEFREGQIIEKKERASDENG